MKNSGKTSTLSGVYYLLTFFLLQTFLFAQDVSTFNNEYVHYGWSGSSFSESAFRSVIDQAFTDNVQKLDIQAKLDHAKISAELLWKITGSIEEIGKFKTPLSSWIWADAQVTGFSVILRPSGCGYIHLFQNNVTVGRLRCHTSSKRIGLKYLQLKPGQYKITQKKLEHDVQEEGLKGVVLEHALYSGVDGKWIHEGEYAESHGCIRVSEPAMIEMYRLVRVGTPFAVIWENEG